MLGLHTLVSMFLCRPAEGISTEFLYWYLVAETAGRKQLNASAYGAGKPGLNLDNIRSVTIDLPEFDEQVEIVAQINKLLSVEENITSLALAETKKAEALRHAILKSAFSGRLVTHDPNDEPASVLLERIQAEKDGQKNGNKNNKRKDAA